jgi:hypothetical protein
MGAQASKAARRLPTKPKAETLENVPTATPSSIAGSQAVSMAGKLPFHSLHRA